MATIYGLRKTDEQTYFYVGSTKFSAQHRFRAHMADVRYGTHSNSDFVGKVNEVGQDNVTVDVLEEVPERMRYDSERDWILRLLKEGHRLTNRAYVSFDPYNFSSSARAVAFVEMTPERFRMAYDAAHSPPPIAQYPDMQKVSDGVHELLRGMIDEVVRRFPEQLAADFGFVAPQENAR